MTLVNPDLFGMMRVASFPRHPPFGGQSLRAFRCRRLVAIEIASLAAIGEYRPSTSDRSPPALRQDAAETGCRGPVLLGLAVPGLKRLALGAGHRDTRYLAE